VTRVAWEPLWADGWHGRRRRDCDGAGVAAWLAAAAGGAGRTSRHARTLRVDDAFVKHYPAPDAPRGARAFAMGRALAAAGFAAPEALLCARRGGEGLLVTADAGGEDLSALVARLGGEGAAGRRAKRRLLHRLGAAVGRLHGAGFVHGDLVPPNLRWRDDAPVFLDNDRTRRLPGAWGGRRNLVQLGRFVVPGVTATDRARVLAGYAAARRLSRRARHRLGRWAMRKITARRCAIDHIPRDAARRAGFRELMRSGGPFDPARVVERPG
jgi:hypothetical protein